MRRFNLAYLALALTAALLAYLIWPQRLLLIVVALLFVLIICLFTWRYAADFKHCHTAGAGLPADADAERGNQEDADLLHFELDILARINVIRAEYELPPLALRSDLLYLARRHSLRMIKLPFFGTADPMEGPLCNRLVHAHGADCAAINVVRVWDDLDDIAGYCIRKWMGRRRTRLVLLSAALTTCTIGIVRNRRDSMQYVTGLFVG